MTTKLLTRQQIEEITGLTRSTIYRLMRSGQFPEPIRIGPRAVRWPQSEIERGGGMKSGLISKATRNAFREALTSFSLREIEMIFDAAEVSPKQDYDPGLSGQRCPLVERYYAGIDFRSSSDIDRLLYAYGELMSQMQGSDESESSRKEKLLQRMERDGYSYQGGRFIPQPSRRQQPLIDAIRNYAADLDLEGLQSQIHRLAQAAENDPSLAVGTAKELVETICKTILETRGVPTNDQELSKLVRATAKELALLPDAIPDNAKGSDVIRRLLSNLNQVVQGLAELRNLYGTGHGRAGRVKGIHPRHARLAVGAATTLATFLLETHLERSPSDGS